MSIPHAQFGEAVRDENGIPDASLMVTILLSKKKQPEHPELVFRLSHHWTQGRS